MTEPDAENIWPCKAKSVVLRYLQGQGYDIKQAAFYNHTKKGHKYFRLRKVRGVYSKDAVDEYATAWLKKESTGATEEDEKKKSLNDRKTVRQIKELDLKIRERELKLEIEAGKYIRKDQFALEVSARAAVLDAGYMYNVNAKILKLIDIAGGDPKNAPAMIAELTKDWNALLTEFAKIGNVEVIFKNV